MPRPKYKSYYTIEIKKESIETIPGETVAQKKFEGEDALEYITLPDKKEAVNKTIYTQTVEIMNLKKVIEAVNEGAKK